MQGCYPPHEQLLLLCARTQMGKEAIARARQLMAGDLDWEVVWELARRHNVTPLIAHSLHRLDGEGYYPELVEWRVPPSVMDRFTRAYRHNALRQALRAEKLASMLNTLHTAGIPVLVLKGTALAYTIYPDPALRVCGDVDLLVRPDDLPPARAVLSGIGRDFMVELAADHYDFWVGLPGKWSVRPPDWESLWNRAVSAEIAGVPALILPPTDLLLSLGVNFVRRGFAPLKLLVDIAEAVRHYSDAISWDAVQNEARQSGLDRLAWHVFGLARRLLDAPLPSELLAPPADLALTWLEARLLAYHQDHVLSPLPLRSLLTLLNGGPLHRVRALRERLLPPRHWLARAYGLPVDDRWVYLYYLRWPLDLLSRYGASLLALLAYRTRDARTRTR